MSKPLILLTNDDGVQSPGLMAAVRALREGHSGVMVALAPPNVDYVPLDDAISRMKTVPHQADTVLTGRDLGICFGDI